MPDSGRPRGDGRRIAIVVARFNDLITERLERGARDALARSGIGADSITVVKVPGAFELPLACRWAAADHDAVVALGCVIRGATDHYEYVCSQASRGCMDAMVATDKPVGFGLLTCAQMDQAVARAGGEHGNKGADAAMAALAMAVIKDRLATGP